MIHGIFQIVLGFLFWKKLPSWLRLNNSIAVDHYVIVGLSLVGVTMIFVGIFRLVKVVCF